jgi:hypothetical protein
VSEQLVGILNENEFYAEHYLCALLTQDIQGRLDTWRAAETPEQPSPPAAFRGLSRAFFRTRERLANERSPEERVTVHAEQCSELLSALGYRVERTHRKVAGAAVPLLAEVRRLDGSPAVWCVPIPGSHGDEASFLSRRLLPAQDPHDPEAPLHTGTAEEIATAAFDSDEPPRFVLLVGEAEVALLERAKWAEQRLLRFDLAEILGRRDAATVQVTATLLARQSLVPDSGSSLLDTLDESSHKHASAVSEDLKFAIREAIELLGNVANDHWRTVSKAAVYGAFESDVERANELGRECLRYAYRIVFILYIEARPELGYAPMRCEAYERGYSFERLRDLEQLELETDEARNGNYIQRCLDVIFRLIYEGAQPARQTDLYTQGSQEAGGGGPSLYGSFTLPALRSHLFDPERTKLLNRVRFPNHVLRRVIEMLSLSRGKDSSGKRISRGRISYATLGVNQLGAVYETLLSYRAFFAQTDLYEVKRADDKEHDELKISYFVSPSDLKDYSEDERVRDEQGKPRMFPKGTFLYRLAGRERQTSASYYTPQSLTRALVKYALQELLFDSNGRLTRSADELLRLKICEPAMGSAAFLNEAVDQLAELYLRARQDELRDRIPHERYAYEKQRVKMLLADNNVFGVDKNPLAIELAEVSLWLNTIHPGGFVPWFGMQLVCGNSLIGAWRKVFLPEQVHSGANESAEEDADDDDMPAGVQTPWLDVSPTRVPLGTARPEGSVYHFFLPDRRMAVYGQGEGEPIKALRPKALALLEERCAALRTPLSRQNRETLVELSDAVDHLWEAHIRMMQRIRHRTTDPLPVYGWTPPESPVPPLSTREKDEVWEQQMASHGVRASSPYRRLKFVMDWCALWFWPIEEANFFPTREEMLLELGLLLHTDVLVTPEGSSAEVPTFAASMDPAEARALVDELGFVDVAALTTRYPRLALVERLAARHRFHHWELEFADVFAEDGGFDLVLGNPPWIRVEWKEQDVLGDVDPSFVLKGLSATDTTKRREQALKRTGMLELYLAEHESAAGTQAFLSAPQNYPDLQGVKVNFYKCFLPVAWALSRPQGASGFLHPEKVYDEPTGGTLRAVLYSRLRRHYQFTNELTDQLFREVDHHQKFSLNVYGPPQASPRFLHIANLFSPSTIEACHAHPGGGRVPGIKTDQNEWELAGHRDRVVEVNLQTLT